MAFASTMKAGMIALVILVPEGSLASPASRPSQATPRPALTPPLSADVRSHGAKGDGAADDTDALQAACTSGSVFLPPGTYLVTRPIALSGRVRIEGAGATIQSSAPNGALFRASGDLAGFVMRDVVLRSMRKDLDKRGDALFSVDYHTVDGALFDNVTFDTGSSYQNAISLAAEVGTRVENVTIRDCSFTGASAGVELVHHVDLARRITGVKIHHNRFVHNGLKDDQYAGFAISLSGPLSRVDVIGNDVRGYPYAGIEVAASSSGSFDADYIIHANTIVGTGRGIITDTGNAGPGTRISRVSIVGNVVVRNRFFQWLEGLADSVVQGNVFETRHTAPSPDHKNDFFAFRHCDRLVIGDNAFRLELPPEEAGKALVAFLGVTDTQISGNLFETSGVHVVSMGSAEKPSTDNSLSGNRFVHKDNGAFSDPVAFGGARTTRNALTASTVVKRHENTISSQAAGNGATGTVTIRSDTGTLSLTMPDLAIPRAGEKGTR